MFLGCLSVCAYVHACVCVCGARREAFLNSLAVEFCYLGDMLSVDGDADAAVEARIRIDWNKFRQLVPLLITRSHGSVRVL